MVENNGKVDFHCLIIIKKKKETSDFITVVNFYLFDK